MPEDQASPWLIYGAYGTLGRLIAETAMRRGHRPVLAGRNPEKLMRVSRELGLPSVAVSLEQPAILCSTLRTVDLVIHAAGPFTQTGRPMLEACIATRTPYLDLSQEPAYLPIVSALGPRAEAIGIPLLTGAGFATTYADSLARYVLDRLPDATHLRLSVAAHSAFITPAQKRTSVAVLAEGGGAFTDGQFTSHPFAHEVWTIRHAGALIDFAATPMPELHAAARSTGVANIVAGHRMSRTSAWLRRTLTPPIRGLLGVPSLRRHLEGNGETEEVNPDDNPDPRCRIWAEAWNHRNERCAAQVETQEAYGASAIAAVLSAESLLKNTRTGALTPGMVFGADLLQTLPDTTLIETRPDLALQLT